MVSVPSVNEVSDVYSEKKFVGSLLAQKDFVYEFIDLDSSVFSNFRLQLIWDYLIHQKGSEITREAIIDFLMRKEAVDRQEQDDFYTEITLLATKDKKDLRYICEKLKCLGIKRACVSVLYCGINDLAYMPDIDLSAGVAEYVEALQQKLQQSVSGTFKERKLRDIVSDVFCAMERKRAGEDKPLCSGLTRLDSFTYGIQPGSLVVIAGRASMGKTSFGLSYALGVKRQLLQAGVKGEVLFLSLEMTAEQIILKALSSLLQIPHRALTEPKYLTKGDARTVSRAAENYNFFSDYLPLVSQPTGASAEYICGVIKKNCYTLNTKLVVIDYLQLVRVFGNAQNRNYEIGEITKKLKSVALSFGICIVILAQLSRAVEGREDKRPVLSDLRDSGEIEQDADVVMLLFRKSYYLERKLASTKNSEEHTKIVSEIVDCRNAAEIFIAKNRNGRVGCVNLFCDMDYCSFADNEDDFYNNKLTKF